MNHEGYKTPTEDAAVGRETKREKLRRKYNVREGDAINMKIEISQGTDSEAVVTGIVKVRVKEIHEHFITVIRPSGIIESFQWQDFKRRRK